MKSQSTSVTPGDLLHSPCGPPPTSSLRPPHSEVVSPRHSSCLAVPLQIWGADSMIERGQTSALQDWVLNCSCSTWVVGELMHVGTFWIIKPSFISQREVWALIDTCLLKVLSHCFLLAVVSAGEWIPWALAIAKWIWTVFLTWVRRKLHLL